MSSKAIDSLFRFLIKLEPLQRNIVYIFRALMLGIFLCSLALYIGFSGLRLYAERSGDIFLQNFTKEVSYGLLSLGAIPVIFAVILLGTQLVSLLIYLLGLLLMVAGMSPEKVRDFRNVFAIVLYTLAMTIYVVIANFSLEQPYWLRVGNIILLVIIWLCFGIMVLGLVQQYRHRRYSK